MRDLVNLFSPNKTLSKRTALLLLGVQGVILILFWMFSPVVFLPSFSETVDAFKDLWDGGLLVDLMTSFKLNVQSIVCALTVSLFLAYSAVMPFFRPVVEFLGKLRFLSLVGLSFFFTLAASNGHELKLYLLSFSITVFFITSMADVLTAIPKTQFDLARTLGMGPWRTTLEVVVIGQMDKVLDVLRQNAAIGWMMLSMVEGMSRSEGGIGAVLLNQNKHFHLSAVLAIQITILLLGLGQDYALGLIRKILCPYADLTAERK